MEIKIYTDVLFFTNFFMDYILLYLSAKLLKVKQYKMRALAGAIIGALGAVAIFFVEETILKFVLPPLMVYIAFLPRSVKSYIKQFLVFVSVSFCVGGAAFSFFYFSGLFQKLGTVFSGGIVYINFPIYKLMISCVVSYGVLSITTFVIKKRKSHLRDIYNVEISYRGNVAQFKAIYDSGNLLKDAATNKSVLVVSWNALKNLFGTKDRFADFLLKNEKEFVPIPYKSVSGCFVMMGFLPDSIKIDNEEREAFIGISEIDFDDFYDAVLPKDFNERVDTIGGINI